MLMYTAPQRRAGVGALFRVHKNGTEPGPRPDLRSEMLILHDCKRQALPRRCSLCVAWSVLLAHGVCTCGLYMCRHVHVYCQ